MQKDKSNIPLEVRNFLSRWGAKGGSSKSEKKAAAVRKNGVSPCKPGKFRGRPSKIRE